MSYLLSLNSMAFFEIWFAINPFDHLADDTHRTLIEKVLCEEYGCKIIASHGQCHLLQSAKGKLECEAAKLHSAQERIANEEKIAVSWPKIIEDSVVFQCLKAYHCGTHIQLVVYVVWKKVMSSMLK